MDNKKATEVEAAPAAIKATKPSTEGKREPEDDLNTKVNLKKPKNDVIAAVQKEKADKKVESSDSSDSEKEEKAKKVPAKADSNSDESSDDESAPKKAVAATNETVAKRSKDDSSFDEESSDEEEVAATKKSAATADTKTAKKDFSSDGSESESESEDEKENTDDETVDAEQKRPKTPATPATGGSKTLFIGNLSFQVEKHDVLEFFKEVGEVVDVRFATSKDDGRFRGFGHVEFATAEQAAKAMELKDKPLLGREVRLDAAI